MPRAGRAGRRVGAGCGTGAAADHRRDAACDRHVDLLRTDEVNVRIDRAGGENVVFAGDRFGCGTDDHAGRDAVHHPRISGFADAGDSSVTNADVGFVDAADCIDDRDVRDHGVENSVAVARRRRMLTHPVANDFSAAEDRFVAVAFRDRVRSRRSDRYRRAGGDRRSSDRRGARMRRGRAS